MVKIACAIVCLLAASVALAQSEFSADIVTTGREGGGKKAKIFFGKDKVRIETAGERGMGGTVIMDLTAHTSTMVMDQQACTCKCRSRCRISETRIISFEPAM